MTKEQSIENLIESFDNFKISQVKVSNLGFCYHLIDTEDKLNFMLGKIANDSIINIDFEGIDLCKTGKVCLAQVHASNSDTVFLVDFITMNPFTAANGKFKHLMESEAICKVFFDPRNDIDAIANQFDINVKNVLCLQLAEVATRRSKGLRVNYVTGLRKAMDEYVHLPYNLKLELMKIKGAGIKLFAPEEGGSYEVFEKRPMQAEILNYAAVDVYYFDQLREKLYVNLKQHMKDKVDILSKERLVEYMKPGYTAKGKSKAFAPRM